MLALSQIPETHLAIHATYDGRAEATIGSVRLDTSFFFPKADSVFICEGKHFQLKDSSYVWWSSPMYFNNPNGWTSDLDGSLMRNIIPFPVISHPQNVTAFIKETDSTWTRIDSSYYHPYFDRWYADSLGGITITVEGVNKDSITGWNYYTWHRDGRIAYVTSYTRLIYDKPDSAVISTCEYDYDENNNLIAYCSHGGTHYPAMHDSINKWSSLLLHCYNESIIYPNSGVKIPTSSAGHLVTFSYSGARLTSMLESSCYGNNSDTLYYDDKGRLERVRSYVNGRKSQVYEFDYELDSGRVLNSRLLTYSWNNDIPNYVTSARYYYGNDRRISVIEHSYTSGLCEWRTVHSSYLLRFYYKPVK